MHLRSSNVSVEDLVLYLTQSRLRSVLRSEDRSFLPSVGKQISRGIQLTDRQYESVKSRLENYRDFFTEETVTFDQAVAHTSLGIRKIDRSKWIKIVNAYDLWDGGTEDLSDKKLLGVKFNFNKKILSQLEKMNKNASDHWYRDHVHYYSLNEKNVFLVVDTFKDMGFEVDEELLRLYEVIKDFHNHPRRYLPCIEHEEIKNLHPNAVKYLTEELGGPNKDNMLLYQDRAMLFGLHSVDAELYQESKKKYSKLSAAIAERVTDNVLVRSDVYSYHDIFESLVELRRDPILVVLSEENSLSELKDLHDASREFIPEEEQLVAFRRDNPHGKKFNQYIKDNNLNGPLDSSKKIVYINRNRLPKTLVAQKWIPRSVVLTESFRTQDKLMFFVLQSDLIIHHDTTPSYWWGATRGQFRGGYYTIT